MVVSDFSGTVFLDTAPLIYYIEGGSPYQSVLTQLFDRNDKGLFTFVTSTITLLEVLVKPLRENRAEIAAQYREILTGAPGIELTEVTSVISEIAANLRAKYGLRTPDAIQLATAIDLRASHFLTNDHRLQLVTEIQIVTLSQLA